MEAYTDFAMVYDTFMDETPYEQWCEFLMELFRKYGAQKDDTRQENSAVMDNLRQDFFLWTPSMPIRTGK